MKQQSGTKFFIVLALLLGACHPNKAMLNFLFEQEETDYISLKALILNSDQVKKELPDFVIKKAQQPNGWIESYAQEPYHLVTSYGPRRWINPQNTLSKAYWNYKYFEINQEQYKQYYQQYLETKPENNPVLIFYRQLKNWGHIPKIFWDNFYEPVLDDQKLRLLIPQLSLSPLFDSLPQEKGGARDRIFDSKEREKIMDFFYSFVFKKEIIEYIPQKDRAKNRVAQNQQGYFPFGPYTLSLHIHERRQGILICHGPGNFIIKNMGDLIERGITKIELDHNTGFFWFKVSPLDQPQSNKKYIYKYIPVCSWQEECYKNPSFIQLILGQYTMQLQSKNK